MTADPFFSVPADETLRLIAALHTLATDGYPHCAACDWDWPCETRQLLDRAGVPR